MAALQGQGSSSGVSHILYLPTWRWVRIGIDLVAVPSQSFKELVSL